ncbi:hypothetical protein SK066_11395 [Paenibacillus hunanensis]|uniref:hypothetical protein n=1 Tax=Paenibacillus hunanensis TaxID=539262 RepID=UPI002A6B0DAC|nr:hypothetical protein [Paenibacillus hunanensis]WPP43490.1 hypothetical protein SK066_11395 [Paenibacillus hunanensis]
MNRGVYVVVGVAAVCFIILAVLRITSIASLTGKWMLYFAIAGTLLVIADLINFIWECYGQKSKRLMYFFFVMLECMLIAAAVFSIFVLPHINPSIPIKTVNTAGDALTLFGLGCAFISMLLKSLRAQKYTTS